MATVSAPSRRFDLNSANRQVRDPLQKLRGHILRYVVVQSLTSLIICVAAWFWIGLLLDYASFQLLTFDWVQDFPRGVRAFLTGVAVFLVWFFVELRALLNRWQADLTVRQRAYRANLPRRTQLATATAHDDVYQISLLHKNPVTSGLLESLAVLVVALGVALAFGLPTVEDYGLASNYNTVMWYVIAALGVAAWFAANRIGYSLGVIGPRWCVAQFVGGLWCAAFVTFNLVWVSPWLAGISVAVALVVLMTAVLITRFRYEFSDHSLAILLERRFSKVLGDRLITAIELNNPREAVKYGYSQEMIEETIAEAAVRVGKLPVSEVFNWKRLYKMAGVAAGLVFGGMILAPLALAGLEVSGQALRRQPVEFKPSYITAKDTGIVWFERNILLKSTIWPRRCMLVLIGFPAGGELKIGEGDAPPLMRVKALKWVVADGDAPEGWRQLLLRDLKPDYLESDSRYLADHRPVIEEKYAELKKLDKAWAELNGKSEFLAAEEKRVDKNITQYSAARDKFEPQAPKRVELDGQILKAKEELLKIQRERVLLGVELKAQADKISAVEKECPTARMYVRWAPNGNLDELPLDLIDARYGQEIRDVVDKLQKEKEAGLKNIEKWEEWKANPEAQKAEGAPKWTADQIDTAVSGQKVRNHAIDEELKLLNVVPTLLNDLGQRCADVSMRRHLRELTIPESVTVVYWGKENNGEFELKKKVDFEYSANFPPLQGDVKFIVKAEDYKSGRKTIAVVPPPAFETVTSEELHPAYLYYTSADPEFLRGKKQAMPPNEINARQVGTITLKVPMGSSLVLTAETNKQVKPIESGGIVIKGREKTTEIPPGVIGAVKFGDRKPKSEYRPVVMEFNNVTTKLDLVIEIEDMDGVRGKKELIILPMTDTTPEIDVKPEVIRTVNGVYMVTPHAIIPFSGRAMDPDGGLDVLKGDDADRNKPRGLDYVYQITPVESPREEQLRAQRAAGLVAMASAEPNEISRLLYQAKLPKELEKQTFSINGRQLISKFNTQVLEHRAFTPDQILGRLANRTPLTEKQRPITLFQLELDDFVKDANAPVNDINGIYGFNLQGIEQEAGEGRAEIRLKAKEKEVQLRYRMTVQVEAVDNNIESGSDPVSNRNRGISKQKYTFMVVSDAELQVEIGREEKRIYDDFRRVVNELLKIRSLMETAIKDLSSPQAANDDFFRSKQIEVGDLQEIMEKQLLITSKVADDYERIYNEMRINRIGKTYSDNVRNKLVNPLNAIRGKEGQVGTWGKTREEFENYRKKLDGTAGQAPALRGLEVGLQAVAANTQLTILILACTEVLDSMQGVQDINVLIKQLRELEEKQQLSEAYLRARIKWLYEQIEKEANK